jgi:prepilin-type N-terminal cleavage/methylation domain-containing protein
MFAWITKLKSQRGTTFLEVMIALTIMGVVTTAIFKLYITQHKNYMTQDDITTIQQNVRASIDELSRHIRMAGYDLPLGLPSITAANTDPDTITITYLSNGCDTYLSAAMPQPSAELKCATDVSCFYDGQWVFIYDPDSAVGEWFVISHVQEAALHLQHNTMTLSRKYQANALILAMTQITFFVDNTTDPNHPNLMIQLMGQTPQVFAEDITDLQFQYSMKNGAVVDVPTVIDNIREISIFVTGRSHNPDLELAEELEDQYRRRAFSTSVYLRNVGI